MGLVDGYELVGSVMALSNLAITFDAQPPVYFPGKPISGRVTFSVTEPLAFDQVRVECFGIVSTKRTKTSTSSGGFPKNVIYSAYEVCCDQDKTVLDGTRGSGTPESVPAKDHAVTNGTEVSTPEHEKPVTLARKVSALKPASKSAIQPGAYSFPFTFFLPIKCPSSFEGSYGHIRYFCKALVTSGGAVQYSGKEAFTVIGWLDLNASPTASLYYQTEANTNTDEKGGKLLVRLYLRQQGYVPGEMVNARMELVNNSTKPVSVIFAQFVQRVTYAAKRENADDWSKWEERKVLQQVSERCRTSKDALRFCCQYCFLVGNPQREGSRQQKLSTEMGRLQRSAVLSHDGCRHSNLTRPIRNPVPFHFRQQRTCACGLCASYGRRHPVEAIV